ncbi:hypothetical protein COLO4_22907 [Corchorus olitorius]|uniref:DNA helicase n=1 Tax=Corchorus olitorius TaxID=93759 RepID=A0A1R3IJC9_9ROSI|nr:hypothetical protein COLO4_22907 [Corchorus olitorius]
MASKGPRSRIEHETRARRQKALEAPREPQRPKTHWDHVLEEMVWLSKDFESERKWKLAQAKKVALRASKGMLDQATRGEKKLKEDDEQTIEEDEALITAEERQEELAALHSEIDLPLQELLKRYVVQRENRSLDVEASPTRNISESSGELAKEDVPYDFSEEQGDGDFTLAEEEKDDETTLSEEEELAKADSSNPIDEIALLQKESEIPVEELLARYRQDFSGDDASGDESEYASALSEDLLDSPANQNVEAREESGTKNEVESSPVQGVVNHSGEEEASPDRNFEDGKESENRIADAAAAARLSRRQRNLYEDFIASSETQATLANANFFGMISIIMQLRKVCNHPDLFEGRPIVSSFDMCGIDIQLSSSVCSVLSTGPFSTIDLKNLGLVFTHLDFSMTSWESDEVQALATPSSSIEELTDQDNLEEVGPFSKHQKSSLGTNIFEEIRKALREERLREAKERAASIAWWNSLRCRRKPVYSTTLCELLTVKHSEFDIQKQKADRRSYSYSSRLVEIILSPVDRFQTVIHLVESFMFAIPAARAPPPVCWCSKTGTSAFLHSTYIEKCAKTLFPLLTPIRPAIVRRQVYFPDRRLIQFDCGKLQELAVLLRRLKSEGHRALIFTQMTKMLDILEAFINLYGYTYMRLDGSTQPEERQTLMQRFNTNPKIFLFILSTRSGGVGINLVGADTVIFYDSDWNPAMDQQAQDRCHRIGQTREVHIYRLISESTIEENILKKANQKRALDDLVIQSGGYNTEFFKKLDPMELFSGHRTLSVKSIQKDKNHNSGMEVSVSNADVEAALKHAEDEADYMALKKVEQEEAVENQEFTEEAMSKLEDDELVNEDDVKADESADQGGCMTTLNKDNRLMFNGGLPIEEKALTFAGKEDDADMLADVKQIAAAAAAAGQAISSFENQLRPIDQYAIRFLELWDPLIDKGAIESEVRFEEAEWELDRIEKYKEEMEAEIDDDEEPLVYEKWDADFATEAYRQQVALAQHQLMEELEYEAKEKELADDGNFDAMNEMVSEPKPKSKKKKKPKKAKFKSLKKGSLSSELKPAKEETKSEPMSIDDDDNSHEELSYSDVVSPSSNGLKKRKKVDMIVHDAEEVKSSKKKPKKSKKPPMELHPVDDPSASRKRNDDCAEEDAILCAVVHEYGPHWSLVSETLYSMTAGGFYRGRYRHPVHCCERYRELIQRHILAAPDSSVNEKISNAGSGKALLKVTEDNIQMLLNVAAQQPDHELLLQKHFAALLSSVWRVTLRPEHRQSVSTSRNGIRLGGRFVSPFLSNTPQSSAKEPAQRMKFTNLRECSKLLSDALHDASDRQQSDTVSHSDRRDDPVIAESLELTLEIQGDSCDSMNSFPPVINVSIYGSDLVTSIKRTPGEDLHLKDSKVVPENRFSYKRPPLAAKISRLFLLNIHNTNLVKNLQNAGLSKIQSKFQ